MTCTLDEIAATAKLYGAEKVIINHGVVRAYLPHDGGVAWFDRSGFKSGNLLQTPKTLDDLSAMPDVAREFAAFCDKLGAWIKE